MNRKNCPIWREMTRLREEMPFDNSFPFLEENWNNGYRDVLNQYIYICFIDNHPKTALKIFTIN